MSDLVERQVAIDALGEKPLAWEQGEYEEGLQTQWESDVEAIKALPSAKPPWIPCSERLPDNRVCVIICFREWQQYAKRYIYGIVIGWYARKHSVQENVFCEWEADCDYDEDEDEFYIHEGWYEFTTQGNADLMNWYINAEVVAWMPLPEPYKVVTE